MIENNEIYKLAASRLTVQGVKTPCINGVLGFADGIVTLAMQVNLAKVESLLRNTEGMSTHAIKEQHVQFNAGVNAALAILRGSDGNN